MSPSPLNLKTMTLALLLTAGMAGAGEAWAAPKVPKSCDLLQNTMCDDPAGYVLAVLKNFLSFS